MKYYRGMINTGIGGQTVLVTFEDDEKTPYPLKHYVLHSPDGFQWGYGGSGPAELARCMLIDHTGNENIPTDVYQRFKWDIIANLNPSAPWNIRSSSIDHWLRINGFMEVAKK